MSLCGLDRLSILIVAREGNRMLREGAKLPRSIRLAVLSAVAAGVIAMPASAGAARDARNRGA
jgi:hypothetical protein